MRRGKSAGPVSKKIRLDFDLVRKKKYPQKNNFVKYQTDNKRFCDIKMI